MWVTCRRCHKTFFDPIISTDVTRPAISGLASFDVMYIHMCTGTFQTLAVPKAASRTRMSGDGWHS